MPRYRDTSKDRQVGPYVNWRPYEEKVDLNKDFKKHKRYVRREKINNSARAISKRIERNSSRRTPSLGGLVGGLVSTIVLIGMVATLFNAYQNSLNPSADEFSYFSISKYAENFDFESGVVEKGNYAVTERFVIPFFTYRGYVEINGVSYPSVNVRSRNLPNFAYIFDIGGRDFIAYPNPLTAFQTYLLTIPETFEYHLEQPNLVDLGNEWSKVDDLLDLPGALSATGKFIIDSIRWESNVIRAVLPWNAVETGSREYLDSLWEDAEEKVYGGS